jgi:alkylation response protein AidB-like acyl-CoA dehydrogenase
VQAAAGLGLTTLTLPPDLGGAGAGPTAYALVVYELAQVDPNTAAILAVHNGLGLRCLLSNPKVAAEVAPKAAAGEIVALLASEEANGSDVAAIGTTAVREAAAGGGFRLTGQKVWGIAASDAKHFVVLATVPPGKDKAQPSGPTLFHVLPGAEGVSLGQNEPIMGLRGAGIRTVYFSGVAVSDAQRLGDVGQGLAILSKARAWLQVGAAAALAGCVSGAFRAAAEFAATRIQFGNPIGTYQAVSDGVTTIDLQVQASLALTLAAAARLDDEDGALWAARAKAFANEMAIPMTRQAIRIQGGTGFMREGGSERFARDARALQFVGETTQMQRDAIKRAVMPDIAFPATP